MTLVRLAVCAFALIGCIESSSVVCDDGTLCPADATCDVANQRCLSGGQVAACDGFAEGAPCTFAGAPGKCHVGACEPFACGDGEKTGTEACDGDDLGGETCASLGFDAETTGLACKETCLFDTSGCTSICGDGVADLDEQCDGADLGFATDCTSLGFYDAPGLACTPFCLWDYAACTGFCGDGVIGGDEECDLANLGGATCLAEGFYNPDGMTCTTSCSRNVGACLGECGDLVINGPELCDGAPPAETCVDLGFDAGPSACGASCGASFAGCARFGWRLEAVGFPLTAIGGRQRDTTWVVGANGRAARFVASAWVDTPTGVTDSLISVSSTSATDAWAIGFTTVIRWNGTAWQPVLDIPSASYNAVFALSPTAVFITTDASGVLGWNGSTWQTVGDIGVGQVNAIGGTSSSDLWAAKSDELVHWDGTSWTAMFGGGVKAIIALATDDVWIAGTLPLSTDGFAARWNGLSWTSWTFPIRPATGLALTAGNNVWVTGGSTIRHFDGTSWTALIGQSASSSQIAQLVAYGDGEILGSSSDGFAHRYRGQTYFPYGGGAVGVTTSLWSSSTTDVFIGDSVGDVHHWDGTSLQATTLAPGVRVEALWGSAPDHVWAATSGGEAYRFDGTVWTEMLQSSGTITTIWGTGPSDVWLFGTGGVRHFDGFTWTVRTPPGATAITTGSGSDPMNVWAVTASNVVWRWDGSTWSSILTSTNKINGIVVLAPGNVHAIEERAALHYNGASWSRRVLPVVLPFARIGASASDDIVIASADTLYHFDGIGWSPMRPPPLSVNDLIRDIQVVANRVELSLDGLGIWKVQTLLRTKRWACRTKETACADAVDDDCDGAIDAFDAIDCP